MKQLDLISSCVAICPIHQRRWPALRYYSANGSALSETGKAGPHGDQPSVWIASETPIMGFSLTSLGGDLRCGEVTTQLCQDLNMLERQSGRQSALSHTWNYETLPYATETKPFLIRMRFPPKCRQH